MSKAPDTWSMDAIQFPRMLAAINDVDLTQQQVEQLCEAMDFEPHHLAEIFSRAQERWKAIESDTRTGHTPVPRVIITVTGGVADVLYKPRDVAVTLLDYDVEGEADVDGDPDGRNCRINQWPAGGEVAGNKHWPIIREAIAAAGQPPVEVPRVRPDGGLFLRGPGRGRVAFLRRLRSGDDAVVGRQRPDIDQCEYQRIARVCVREHEPSNGKELTMRILFVNNDGGGFADYVEVAPGTTVEKFFCEKMPGRSASDFLLRVNRQPVARDQVLQEGDRVTATPVKIQGAQRAA